MLRIANPQLRYAGLQIRHDKKHHTAPQPTSHNQQSNATTNRHNPTVTQSTTNRHNPTVTTQRHNPTSQPTVTTQPSQPNATTQRHNQPSQPNVTTNVTTNVTLDCKSGMTKQINCKGFLRIYRHAAICLRATQVAENQFYLQRGEDLLAFGVACAL